MAAKNGTGLRVKLHQVSVDAADREFAFSGRQERAHSERIAQTGYSIT